MRFVKASTTTLRQQVHDQLREKIVYAGVLPGETLSLRGLAREFGVSLMPIREAVWQLESERVVVVETNRRIRVNTRSVVEMQEIFQIRLLLESLRQSAPVRCGLTVHWPRPIFCRNKRQSICRGRPQNMFGPMLPSIA